LPSLLPANIAASLLFCRISQQASALLPSLLPANIAASLLSFLDAYRRADRDIRVTVENLSFKLPCSVTTIIQCVCRVSLVHSHPHRPTAAHPNHPRQTSFDQQTSQQLEGKLANRPDKAELIERNILKGMFHPSPYETRLTSLCADDKGLAPALVAAKERLQRSQLEDQLAKAVASRPPREELEKSGILKGSEEEEAPAAAAA